MFQVVRDDPVLRVSKAGELLSPSFTGHGKRTRKQKHQTGTEDRQRFGFISFYLHSHKIA